MVWCRSESSMGRPHNHQHLSLTSQVGVARTMLVLLEVSAAHPSDASVDRATQHAPAPAAHRDNGEPLFVQNCAVASRIMAMLSAVPARAIAATQRSAPSGARMWQAPD
jgi:hypothetical protein